MHVAVQGVGQNSAARCGWKFKIGRYLTSRRGAIAHVGVIYILSAESVNVMSENIVKLNGNISSTRALALPCYCTS